MENVNCFIAQAIVWQFVEQHWGHTVLLSVDGPWQRARASSAYGHRRVRQGKAQLVERLLEPTQAECALRRCLCCPAESQHRVGSSVGSGVQLGLMGLGARCEWTDRGTLGFSSCFCGDGNLPGSLINLGSGRKLLFQSLVFVVLLPLVWMSLRSLRQRGMLCMSSWFLTPLSVSLLSLLFAWVLKLFYLVFLNVFV